MQAANFTTHLTGSICLSISVIWFHKALWDFVCLVATFVKVGSLKLLTTTITSNRHFFTILGCDLASFHFLMRADLIYNRLVIYYSWHQSIPGHCLIKETGKRNELAHDCLETSIFIDKGLLRQRLAVVPSLVIWEVQWRLLRGGRLIIMTSSPQQPPLEQ